MGNSVVTNQVSERLTGAWLFQPSEAEPTALGTSGQAAGGARRLAWPEPVPEPFPWARPGQPQEEGSQEGAPKQKAHLLLASSISVGAPFLGAECRVLQPWKPAEGTYQRWWGKRTSPGGHAGSRERRGAGSAPWPPRSGTGGCACNPRRLCCSTVTEAAGSPAPSAGSRRRELKPGWSAHLNWRARRALIGPREFEWGGFHLTEQTLAKGGEALAPQLRGQSSRPGWQPSPEALRTGKAHQGSWRRDCSRLGAPSAREARSPWAAHSGGLGLLVQFSQAGN